MTQVPSQFVAPQLSQLQGIGSQKLMAQQQEHAAALRRAVAGTAPAGVAKAAREQPSVTAWNAGPEIPAAPAAGAAPADEPEPPGLASPQRPIQPLLAAAATDSPSRPAVGLGPFSAESPGVVAPGGSPSSSSEEPAATPTRPALPAKSPTRTPRAAQQQQERRLSGGFLDILASISPQPSPKPASPAPPVAAPPATTEPDDVQAAADAAPAPSPAQASKLAASDESGDEPAGPGATGQATADVPEQVRGAFIQLVWDAVGEAQAVQGRPVLEHPPQCMQGADVDMAAEPTPADMASRDDQAGRW